MIQLRPYQQKLIDDTEIALSGGTRRTLIQLPTGGGKGRILPRLAKLRAQNGRRVLIVAHRAELIDQICAALDDENMAYGRVQPGHPMLRFPIQVGMVQTVSRRLHKLVPPDDIMVDEAHHMPAGQYVAMLEAWPEAALTGLTATPVRTDQSGLGDYFDLMVQGPTTAELIAEKFLADYEYYMPSPDFDAAGIGTQMGDFNPGEALRAMSKAKIVGDAVSHYRKYLAGRPAIVFCMGVKHTHDVAAEFSAAGIRAAGVDGKMDMSLRKSRLAALAAGELDVITAADVISEGVDIPAVAGAIMLRPTCSTSLFLQQVGRALRPKKDGSKAILLDHVGNARRHGLPADPRRWSLDKAEAPKIEMKTCSRCMRVFAKGTEKETASAQCARAGSEDDPCPMLITAPPANAQKEISQIVSGELEAVLNPWAWAGGIDPVLARGPEWTALIDKANTEDRLNMVARARGYKRGWVQHILRSRGADIPMSHWQRKNTSVRQGVSA